MNTLFSKPQRCPIVLPTLILLFVLAPLRHAEAENWPHYLKDSSHSASCDETITPGRVPLWVHDTGTVPSPGFYPQLRADTLGPAQILAPTSTFDYAYAPIVVDGRLFFASSTLEAIVSLDVENGKTRWVFPAEGAIRFAPLYHNGRVYFGSDDGRVYAVDAETGRLAWKHEVAPEPRRIIANGRIASQWPVRTSVEMVEDTLYVSAGLFPSAGGVFLCALSSRDGSPIWKRNILTPSQGYLLADNEVLLVPNGRASPAEYNRSSGEPLAPESDLRREGGAAFLCRVGEMLAYGPSEYGILRFRTSPDPLPGEAPQKLRSSIRGKLTGVMGWRIAIRGNLAYFLRWNRISAVPLEELTRILRESADQLAERQKDRKIVAYKSMVQQAPDAIAEREIDGAALWTSDAMGARSLIVTADHAFVGIDGAVLGFDLATGQQDFRLPVDGTAWELAASDGRLFASTSHGKIYCFGKGEPSTLAGELARSTEGTPQTIRELASFVLSQCAFREGYCLVLGAGNGRFAAELAAGSRFHIVCVETDRDVAAQARDFLMKARWYGNRVVVHVVEQGKLPYLSYFANLIVSNSDSESIPFSPAEILACLRPHGGTLVFRVSRDSTFSREVARISPEVVRRDYHSQDMGVYVRGAIAGEGSWTHMFADAANTSCSQDALVGGTQYRLQWFGDPSPPKNAGWHANGMGPLFKNGRLFQIKIDHLEVVDAYNGTSLWSVDLPGSTRLSPAREGGSACVDDDSLYFAVKNDCRVYDVATGRQRAVFTTPDRQADWGFIAVSGSRLFGTQQRAGASNDDTSLIRGLPTRQLWSASEAEFVISDSLFSLDRTNGRAHWKYSPAASGILNSSITLDASRIFLVESRLPDRESSRSGSLRLRDFLGEGSSLVCLDQQNGTTVWRRGWNPKARTMLYLSRIQDALVASYAYHTGPLADLITEDATSVIEKNLRRSSADVAATLRETKIRFAFERIDPRTGATVWLSEYTSDSVLGAQHNYNHSHPVLVGGTIYHNPAEQYLVEVDLATGRLVEHPEISRAKGCATPTGSARAIFYRSMGIASFDFESGQSCFVSDVNRPSCWMNVLPAGGLLLMPEYSMGCNCAFPLQTSIVLAPGSFPFQPDVVREGQRIQ